MSDSVNWLPQIDNCCCGYVKDLKITVLAIAAVTVIHIAFTFFRVCWPLCFTLLLEDGMGTALLLLDILYLFGLIILLTVTIILFISTVLNRPLAKPFVLMILVTTCQDILRSLLNLLIVGIAGYVCQSVFLNEYVHPNWMILQFMFSFASGALFIYFAMVVNSYMSQLSE
ncbi:hypothetical protein O0L34_g1059 [Tuta absoluta]|nr:hypothetical protein O0L34_g1059 [Tuta absoluta]